MKYKIHHLFKANEQYENISAMLMMLGLAFIIGIVAGGGAVLFRMLIAFFHNVFFLGTFSVHYNANLHTPAGRWGAWIIFAPVIGALGVSWLVKTFAPEAKGHGVPEVMDAVYNRQGKIRPIVAVVKSIASALTIGSGGSVGREGPIVQIGSAFGSTIGQFIDMPVRQRAILIAAGAGAGIAATFNAPIGGLAFAIELMLLSVSAASISVVVVSTITATYIGRLFWGLTPSFNIPTLSIPVRHIMSLSILLWFIPFGILLGIASAAFIRGLYWFEDLFDSLFKNYYVRHMTGMLVFGLAMYCFFHFTGRYYIEGVGYATIVNTLLSQLTNPWFLLLLFATKFLATCLTIGSGGSGGVFSPSLFLGATLGTSVGLIIQHFFPGLHINPVTFSLAGMAAMVGGTTGAVLTSIAMIYELTGDYSAILPIMISVSLAHGVRKLFCFESIYTLKLVRRGTAVHEGLQAAVYSAQRAKDIMDTRIHIMPLEEVHHRFSELIELMRNDETIIVEKDKKIFGFIRGNYTLLNKKIMPEEIEFLVDKNYLTVAERSELPKILRSAKACNCNTVLVSKHISSHLTDDVVGVIGLQEIAGLVKRLADYLV